nr:RNA ligase family protein [Pectobacterium colocasium]
MNLHSIPLLKYPRTPHLEGSRLQSGDDGSDQIALKALAGRYVVIEEKIDGANSGVSFNETAELLLQSRGHYLAGGSRERQFNQFKLWATGHEMRFLELLEDRFVMYGEWAYSKHSVFYDRLPHYFHEFDIYDRRDGIFLSTARRHAMLAGSPVLSVPVLWVQANRRGLPVVSFDDARTELGLKHGENEGKAVQEQLTSLLPTGTRVPTVLTDRGFTQFDALFHWED